MQKRVIIMNKITKNLFQCLRNTICGESQPLVEMTDSEQEAFFKLACRQDVAHLVSKAIAMEQNHKISEQYIDKFKQQENLALYRYLYQNQALEDVKTLFADHQISFLPLKGSVIRKLYPQEWMRTSSDIDILIQDQDYDRARELLVEKCNFTAGEFGKKDTSFYQGKLVHLELHLRLLKDDTATEFSPEYIWSHVTQENYHCVMTEEDFYAYHIEHMRKHFMTGGCGIRFFLDLWILNHCNDAIQEQKRQEKLERCELKEFEQAVRRLSEVWFGQEQHTETTKQVEAYVLSGGIYGSVENWAVLQGVQQGGSLKSIWKRLWLPYEQLCWDYPSLEGRRYLQPYYEAKRFVRMIVDGRWKRSVTEVKASVRKKDQDTVERMMQELKLK